MFGNRAAVHYFNASLVFSFSSSHCLLPSLTTVGGWLNRLLVLLSGGFSPSPISCETTLKTNKQACFTHRKETQREEEWNWGHRVKRGKMWSLSFWASTWWFLSEWAITDLCNYRPGEPDLWSFAPNFDNLALSVVLEFFIHFFFLMLWVKSLSKNCPFSIINSQFQFAAVTVLKCFSLSLSVSHTHHSCNLRTNKRWI